MERVFCFIKNSFFKKTSFLVVCFCLCVTSGAEVISGAVSKNSDGSYIIRTAQENIFLSSLSERNETHRQLSQQFDENISEPVIADFDIPPELISKRERIPFGTRGDCNELPVSVDDLIKNVEEGGENMTLQDFLESIPEGTMEGFTFITNTRSLQRGEGDHLVDEEWPRVIRNTMDGKLTISFVCHPDQEKHNTVEIIHFDDETQQFKTLSFDFNAPSGRGSGSSGDGKRIHENPQSCIACHGTSDKNGTSGSEHLKLNWPEYFFWGDCDPRRGITMYGMSDDNMGPQAFRGRPYRFEGCNSSNDRRADESLKRDFARFQEKSKTNPCLQTLPWAKMPERGQERVGIEKNWRNEDYSFYPYARRAQLRRNDETELPNTKDERGVFNYSLRTNARMTDTYGHLTAQRNARLFKDNPRYDEFKYYLAMEGLRNCLSTGERQRIASELGISVGSGSNRNTDARTFPLAFAYGTQVVGFENQDWGMHPPERLSSNPRSSGSDYNTVIFSDTRSDHGIHDVMLGDIIKDVTNGTDMESQAEAVLPRGIEITFGSRFSCIDDLGQGVSRRRDGEMNQRKQALCDSLRSAAEANKILLGRTPTSISSECVETKEISIPENLMSQIMSDQARRGRQLVDSCVGCHTGDHELGFITEEASDPTSPEILRLKQIVQNDADSFWAKVEGHLNGTIEPRMPFGCDGSDCMNQGQTDAIVAYLKSLASDDYERVTQQILGEAGPSRCESVNERNGPIELPGPTESNEERRSIRNR